MIRARTSRTTCSCRSLPRLCEANRYSVRAWLLGTGEPACLRAGEEEVAADELPACLDELREELLDRQIEPDRAWVELLLPRELLCADVDQWRVELDFIESIPIGVEHRLVVRSLERASRPRAALALQSRAGPCGGGCGVAAGWSTEPRSQGGGSRLDRGGRLRRDGPLRGPEGRPGDGRRRAGRARRGPTRATPPATC